MNSTSLTDELLTGRLTPPVDSVELHDQYAEPFWIDHDMLVYVAGKRYWTGEDSHLYIEVHPTYRAKKTVEMRLDRYVYNTFQSLEKSVSRMVHKNGNIRDCTHDNLAMLSGRSKEKSVA